MRYYLGNNILPLIYVEIPKTQYNMWVDFYKKYKRFEDLKKSFSLTTNAQQEMSNFLESIKRNGAGDIDILHNQAINQFTKYVMLNRLYIDNCKFFL